MKKGNNFRKYPTAGQVLLYVHSVCGHKAGFRDCKYPKVFLVLYTVDPFLIPQPLPPPPPPHPPLPFCAVSC